MSTNENQQAETLQEDEIEAREDENENHEELEYLAGTGTDDAGEAEAEVETETETEEEYSEKVRKRVGRLTKKYRDEERNRLAAEARAEAAEARLIEFEEKQQEAAKETYENAEKSIKERIKLAAEEEDWAEVMKGNDDLRELDKKHLRRPAPQRKPAPTRDPGPTMAPNAEKWMEDNADWFLEEGPNYNKERAARAIRLSKTLQKNEEYDPNDPELYDVLNEKLGLAPVNGGDDDNDEAPVRFVDRGRRSTNTGSRGPRRPSKKGNSLSAHDKKLMRVFLLDPDSKTDQDEWIKRRNG